MIGVVNVVLDSVGFIRKYLSVLYVIDIPDLVLHASELSLTLSPELPGAFCIVTEISIIHRMTQIYPIALNTRLGTWSESGAEWVGVLSCDDVDECTKSPCSTGHTCVNLISGFICLPSISLMTSQLSSVRT